jgi:multiple sugar transport system ATP-binding protein
VMKDGVIQQCGAPLEVYHRPANRFVAGFVGTPPMNFLEGTIASEGGKLWFDEGTGRIVVPDWARDALAGKVGSKVVMGVRPQAISDRPHAANGQVNGRHASGGSAEGMKDNVLPMKIGVVEFLGDKMDVYVSTASHSHVIAHIDAHRGLVSGETYPMHFDLNRMHFFELGELGAKLATAPAAA